jgi:hypothetical protein
LNRWKNYISVIECTYGQWCYADRNIHLSHFEVEKA